MAENLHIALAAGGMLSFLRHVSAVVIVLAVAGVGSSVFAADSSSSTEVHILPDAHSLSSHHSILGKDYRVHVFHSENAEGSTIEVPTYLFDVFTPAGAWVSPTPAEVPSFPEPIPLRMRDKVQLFYSRITGWVISPRNWHFWNVAAGADGSSSFEFLAPSGSDEGWMTVGVSAPCGGCGTSEAAGLVPDTANAFKKSYQLFDGLLSPNAKLTQRSAI